MHENEIFRHVVEGRAKREAHHSDFGRGPGDSNGTLVPELAGLTDRISKKVAQCEELLEELWAPMNRLASPRPSETAGEPEKSVFDSTIEGRLGGVSERLSGLQRSLIELKRRFDQIV